MTAAHLSSKRCGRNRRRCAPKSLMAPHGHAEEVPLPAAGGAHPVGEELAAGGAARVLFLAIRMGGDAVVDRVEKTRGRKQGAVLLQIQIVDLNPDQGVSKAPSIIV